MAHNWVCSNCKSYNPPRRGNCWKCGKSQFPQSDEQLKLILQIYLEDYRIATDATNYQLTLTHQVFSLTIAAIAALLGAAPFIIQYEVPIIFGVASLVFYGLALAQLRHTLAVVALHKYCAGTLAPNVKATLKEISPSRPKNTEDILSWHLSKSKAAYMLGVWQLPIEAARYLIPVVAGIACCIAYWFTSSLRVLWLDLSVVSLNIFWSLYIIVISLVARDKHVKKIK